MPVQCYTSGFLGKHIQKDFDDLGYQNAAWGFNPKVFVLKDNFTDIDDSCPRPMASVFRLYKKGAYRARYSRNTDVVNLRGIGTSPDVISKVWELNQSYVRAEYCACFFDPKDIPQPGFVESRHTIFNPSIRVFLGLAAEVSPKEEIKQETGAHDFQYWSGYTLVTYFETRGAYWCLTLVLVGWYFLLRMQSEGFPLEKGDHTEAGELPEGRHSAVWVDAQYTTHIRLAKRKNRPRGSYLKRRCTCAQSGSRKCLGHRLKGMIAHLPNGTKIFAAVTPTVLKAEIRRALVDTDPKAKLFGFKGFRAGRATEMAKLGLGLASILLAGEGRAEPSYATWTRTRLRKEKCWRRR